MIENLRSRSDLIAVVARASEVPAIRRACVTGQVEVLGGFDTIPPGTLAGWILSVTAKHGTHWYVAVLADTYRHRYIVRTQPYAPWRLWIGERAMDDETGYSIYSGDHPGHYLDLRQKELAHWRELLNAPTTQSIPHRV